MRSPTETGFANKTEQIIDTLVDILSPHVEDEREGTTFRTIEFLLSPNDNPMTDGWVHNIMEYILLKADLSRLSGLIDFSIAPMYDPVEKVDKISLMTAWEINDV